MVERKSFALINPNQQLKIVFLVNILCFVVCAIYPIALFAVFKSLEPETYVTNEIKEELFLKLLGFFLVFQIIFQIFISYMLILYTKKISKPVEKFGDFLESLVDGNNINIVKFKEDDFFQDLGPVFKILKRKEENKHRVIINLERELDKLLEQEDQESNRNTFFFLKSEVSSLK